MRLLVMRHAQAVPGFPDAQRHLSVHGRATLELIEERLKEEFEGVDLFLVSPYLRTRETFETLLPGREYVTNEVLVPESTPEAVAELLQTLPEQATVMLVSHMPLVGDLAGWLVDGAGYTNYGFATAQIDIFHLEYPAAGLGTRVASYLLDR